MTSREWLRQLCDTDDPFGAYNYYDFECDDDCDCECDDDCSGEKCIRESPTKPKKNKQKDNICPDCKKEGEEKGTACICKNTECKRHCIWGF